MKKCYRIGCWQEVLINLRDKSYISFSLKYTILRTDGWWLFCVSLMNEVTNTVALGHVDPDPQVRPLSTYRQYSFRDDWPSVIYWVCNIVIFFESEARIEATGRVELRMIFSLYLIIFVDVAENEPWRLIMIVHNEFSREPLPSYAQGKKIASTSCQRLVAFICSYPQEDIVERVARHSVILKPWCDAHSEGLGGGGRRYHLCSMWGGGRVRSLPLWDSAVSARTSWQCPLALDC